MRFHVGGRTVFETGKRTEPLSKIALARRCIVAVVACSALVILLLSPWFSPVAVLGAVAFFVGLGSVTCGIWWLAFDAHREAVEDDDVFFFLFSIFLALFALGLTVMVLVTSWEILNNA